MATDPPSRARKLAAMAQTEGPEGEAARQRLQALVARRPDLSWLLEADALELDQISVNPETWLHVDLLQQLSDRLECALVSTVPGYQLHGPRGQIRQVMEHYERFGEPLSAAMDVAGRALLNHCVLPVAVEPEIEPDAWDDDDLEALIPELERRILQHERFAQALNQVPRKALERASDRLAALLAPALSVPMVSLPHTARTWNDPALTYAEFVVIHHAHFPTSELLDYELRFLFRDGKRLYPPTRRYRLCPELARSESWDAWDPQ